MAEALYASEPKSEWRVFDGANAVAGQRFVATPSAVADAAGAPLAPEPLADTRPVDEPARQPSTQVLLRIRADADQPEVLLDGCLSTANPITGAHALPSFRRGELVAVDGNGRNVPAPIVVGCLVDDDARVPEVVKVQVVQRTFVDGVQVDKNKESIVSEAELEPFVPGDARASTLTVAYPTLFTKGPYITLVDRSKMRDRFAQQKTRLSALFLAFMGQVVGAGSDVHTQMQRAANSLDLFGNLAIAFQALLAAIGYARVGVAQSGDAAIPAENAAREELGKLLWLVFVVGPSAGVPDANRYQTNVDIPLSALPDVLRRITRFDLGEDRGDNETPWTFEDLRKHSRVAEAALLEYFQYLGAAPGVLAAIAPRQIPALWMDIARRRYRYMNLAFTDATRQALDQSWRALYAALFEDDPTRNLLEVHGLQRKTLEWNGYVEFEVRVVVVKRGLSTTIALPSSVAREAGWYASGSADAFAAFETAARETIEQLQAAGAKLHRSPVVRGRLTGRMRRDVVAFLAGYRQPELELGRDQFVAHLQDFVSDVRNALIGPGGVASNLSQTPPVKVGPLPRSWIPSRRALRLLPQRVVSANVLVPNARLQADNSIEYASESRPLSSAKDGVGQAIAACGAAAPTVRSAAVQFLEMMGSARARLRLHQRFQAPALLLDFDRLNPNRVRALPAPTTPSNSNPLTVRTRNLYAVRQPLDVLDAVEAYGQHDQIGARTRIGWLTRPVGGDANSKPDPLSWSALLGVGASHADELAAGAFFDLVCTDIVARQSVGERARLMSSPEAFAAEQLAAAAQLAKEAFDANAAAPTRIEDDDAFYDCLPGGVALRCALRESPAWRRWGRPMDAFADADRVRRLELAHTTGSGTPVHYAALAAALKRGGAKLQAPKGRSIGMPYERAPYTSVQTLVVADVGSALAQVEAAWDALARVGALCEAMAPLGVTPARRVSAIVDAAAARPILEIAAAAPPPPPTAARPWPLTDLLARAVRVPAAQIQASVADAVADGAPRRPPADARSPAVRGRLQARLASMRLDLEAVADEGVDREAVDPLSVRMRRCTMAEAEADDKCTLLVPFAAGEPPALHPDLCNAYAFDQTPVFTGAVLRRLEALVGDAAALARSAPTAPCTIECYEIAWARRQPKHPMQIATSLSAPNRPRVEVGVVLGSLRIPDDPVLTAAELAVDTLRDALGLARDASNPAGRGWHVDATSAVLWTIERLVQALHVALASFDGVDAVVAPPPPFVPPVRPSRPPLMEDFLRPEIDEAIRMRLVMIVLMYRFLIAQPRFVFRVGDVDVPVEVDAAIDSESALLCLQGAVEPAGALEPEREEAATGATPWPSVAPELGAHADVRDAMNMTTEQLAQEIENSQSNEGSIQRQAFLYAQPYMLRNGGWFTENANMEKLVVILASHDKYEAWLRERRAQAARLRASEVDKRSQQDTIFRWRVAAAAARHRALIGAWPLLVGTATSIVEESVQIAIPVVDAVDGDLREERAALEAARSAGVKAVPLCEWAAVLARTLPVTISP